MTYASSVFARLSAMLRPLRETVLVVFLPSFDGRPGLGWKLSYVAALCALLAGACNWTDADQGPGPIGPIGPVDGAESGVPGSGDRTTEVREVPDFDKLVFFSEGEVILTQSATVSLSIEADDNLHQYLTTSVSDGELTISTADDIDVAPSESMVFRVGVVNLTRIELAGAGAVTVETLDASDFEVALSGVGDIVIDRLFADVVIVDLGGVGTIRLKGEADQQRVVVSGTGEYDGADLTSRSASVQASGTSTAIVNATDELDIVVSELGEVAFYGFPNLAQEVAGSGTVTSLGAR